MARWRLAALAPQQLSALQELERDLGLVLIAYATAHGAEAAGSLAAMAGPEPDPEILAALNETYRTPDSAEGIPTYI